MFAAERNRTRLPQNSGDEQNVHSAGQPREVTMYGYCARGSMP